MKAYLPAIGLALIPLTLAAQQPLEPKTPTLIATEEALGLQVRSTINWQARAIELTQKVTDLEKQVADERGQGASFKVSLSDREKSLVEVRQKLADVEAQLVTCHGATP